MITVQPASRSRASVAPSHTSPWRSSPAAGSSSSSKRGPCSSARAIASRWRIPRENVRTRLPARDASPHPSSAVATRARASVESVQLARKNVRFSAARQLVVKQRAVRDHSDISPFGSSACESHAPARRPHQQRRDPQKSRLARAVRPKQRDEFARRDLQRHAAQRLQRAKSLLNLFEGNSQARCHSGRRRRGRRWWRTRNPSASHQIVQPFLTRSRSRA